MQRQRGCGRAPRVPKWIDGDRRCVWTSHSEANWRTECARRHTQPDDAAATEYYSEAGVAGSVAVLGEAWPCCPQAYRRTDLPGSDLGAQRHAAHALRLYEAQQSIGLEATTRLPLIPDQANLLLLIHRAVNHRQRAQLDAMKPKGKGEGGSDG